VEVEVELLVEVLELVDDVLVLVDVLVEVELVVLVEVLDDEVLVELLVLVLVEVEVLVLVEVVLVVYSAQTPNLK